VQRGHTKVRLNKETCCILLYELTPFSFSFFFGVGGGHVADYLFSLLIFEFCVGLSVRMVC